MLQFKPPFMGIPSYWNVHDHGQCLDHVQCGDEFLSLYFSFKWVWNYGKEIFAKDIRGNKANTKGLLPAFMDIKCFQQCLAYGLRSKNMGYWLFIILLNWMHILSQEGALSFFFYRPFDWTNPKALHWNPLEVLSYSKFYGSLMEEEQGKSKLG